jgi:hypothetical protein
MTPYQIEMINRLHEYETEFEARFQGPQAKNMTETLADHWARMKSGLTCEGLCTARVYAGKYATMKPGVVCYLDGTWGIVAPA